MKKLLTVVILITTSFLCKAQSWSALGTGLNNQVWALTVYNGKLIAGGDFDSAGGKPAYGIAEWNDTSWSAIGRGMNSTVSALTVYNGKLVAGGYFSIAGGDSANYIAEWDGTKWSALGTGVDAPIDVLTVYNGDLIAGGIFTVAGGNSVACIAKWNGTSWSNIGGGVGSNNFRYHRPEVWALGVYNGNLYAGGKFTSAGGKPANSVAEWNGISWSSLDSGVDMYADVDVFSVYNGNLLVAGSFDSAGGKPVTGLAEWNGTSWSTPAPKMQYRTSVLVNWDSNLYAGGAGGYEVAEWTGAYWSDVGGMPYPFTGWGAGGWENVLIGYNNNLYAAGAFRYAGGIRANYIARLNAPPPVTDTIQHYYTGPLRIYPNPSWGIFNIEIPAGNGSASIKMYDVLGQEIYASSLLKGSLNQINLDNKSAGVYLYRIVSGNGNLIGQGKLVIER